MRGQERSVNDVNTVLIYVSLNAIFFNLKNVYVLRPHFGGEEKQGRGCSGLVSRLKNPSL